LSADNQTHDVVRQQVTVRVPQSTAFTVWTTQIHRWWPTASHSLSHEAASQVVIEPHAGGRFLERTPDGGEHQWGKVLIWDPPARLAFSWFMGSGAQMPSRVDVRFIPVTPRETRVELEHRGPEFIGALWEARKGIFAAAWEQILARYARQAPTAPPP